ncbi:DUF2752 domain-containing protein [Roseiconus nitratireducens]|uniref:DUF2752 domain-containing protein n=1 Tax=Roseiconus nitratireducens TaxID=2605748 RepID=UPI001375A028|nr:DUF2752 domain-containing protein [Roseiconus nitratireducens]
MLLIATLLTPLLIASQLQPSDSGLGTHQRLGLPPCSVRMLFGIRCPSCGMTTSWAHVTRGNVIQAARCNTGGTLLAGYAIASIGIAAGLVWTGRWPSRQVLRTAAIVLIGIASVTFVDWLYRLLRA